MRQSGLEFSGKRRRSGYFTNPYGRFVCNQRNHPESPADKSDGCAEGDHAAKRKGNGFAETEETTTTKTTNESDSERQIEEESKPTLALSFFSTIEKSS